ncbi:DUF3969 family protein [Chitinivorax sp. B]|uniref:DUF3969 family protein n=1 Tax=Chitinivorax sp. B TaxID=2502235 RepID=UPI0010F9C70E|nr:DUF3969 family protein [Chitinivorax sp. B]
MTSDELNRLERLFFVISIGLCHAIKNGAIDIEEADRLLYSPGTLHAIKGVKASETLYDLIYMGTELEGTEMLVPQNLGKELDEMIEISMKALQQTPESSGNIDRWFTPIFD